MNIHMCNVPTDDLDYSNSFSLVAAELSEIFSTISWPSLFITSTLTKSLLFLRKTSFRRAPEPKRKALLDLAQQDYYINYIPYRDNLDDDDFYNEKEKMADNLDNLPPTVVDLDSEISDSEEDNTEISFDMLEETMSMDEGYGSECQSVVGEQDWRMSSMIQRRPTEKRQQPTSPTLRAVSRSGSVKGLIHRFEQRR